VIAVARTLAAADRAAVLALLDRVAAHDGVPAVGEVGLLELRAATGRATHLLARSDDGALAGYAWTDGRSAELAVDPAHRRRGHGSALLRALPGAPGVWAHGDLAAARALAAAHGLVPTRELWRMTWRPAASAAAPPPLPAGVVVRAFQGGAGDSDARAWVALNSRIFRSHPEQGRLTTGDLARRMAEPWFDRDAFLLVVTGEGELIAYLWLKPGEVTDEVYVIGVSPAYQRRGIGAHLLGLAQERTAARDGRVLTLYVEGDNLAAVRSYVRAGFRRDSVDVQYSIHR